MERRFKFCFAALSFVTLALLGCGASSPQITPESNVSAAVATNRRFTDSVLLNKKRLASLGQSAAASPVIKAGYAQSILDKLVVSTRLPAGKLGALISDCPALGDHARNDGSIVLCRATLKILTSESEVAFLIAHEASHLILRHGRNDEARSKEDLDGRMEALKWLGWTGWEIAKARALDKRTGFQRIDEREADLLAIDLIVAGGYNPLGADGMFDLLSRSNLGRRSYAEEESERRVRDLRKELDKPHPDGAQATFRLLKSIEHKAIANSVDSREHDDAQERRSRTAIYIRTFYVKETARPVGTLPWLEPMGGLRANFDWSSI